VTCAFFQLEENVPLPDFDTKTNNVINEIFVTISEIVDILKIIDPYNIVEVFIIYRDSKRRNTVASLI
jgi:hypothetical protein